MPVLGGGADVLGGATASVDAGRTWAEAGIEAAKFKTKISMV